MWKRIALLVAPPLLGAAALVVWPESAQVDALSGAGAGYNTRIKPVWLDELQIRAHLEREYRPGEEP